MKNKILAIALAAAGLTGLSAAHAADTNGFFINGNIGQSNLDKNGFDDNDTAFAGNVGYRWAVAPSVLLGVEGGYTDLGKFDAKRSLGAGKAELKGWNLGVDGHFNVANNWYISGRGGFFRGDRTVSFANDLGRFDDTKNGWYAGAGFGYDFNTNVSLGLNYDYYKVDKNGFDISPSMVSVSGEYRF
jgi:OOP family OmpA-OmpF porin/outer membrane immunogenic protein